jgi:hypothetical protein
MVFLSGFPSIMGPLFILVLSKTSSIIAVIALFFFFLLLLLEFVFSEALDVSEDFCVRTFENRIIYTFYYSFAYV